MPKPPKKPAAVAEAEAFLAARWLDLQTAEMDVSRRLEEVGQAAAKLRAARIEADSALPQCRMVEIRRYSGDEKDISPVVIVRRTPTGMLVVRCAGEAGSHEWKFKWAEFGGRFRQAENWSSLGGHRELRDVPAEYLPTTESQT